MMFSFSHLLLWLRFRCGIASAGGLVSDRGQTNQLDDGPIAHSLAFFSGAPSPDFSRMFCLFMFEILVS
jgi:hypothetical protein